LNGERERLSTFEQSGKRPSRSNAGARQRPDTAREGAKGGRIWFAFLWLCLAYSAIAWYGEYRSGVVPFVPAAFGAGLAAGWLWAAHACMRSDAAD
jgi:hypothetical protein